MTNRVLLDVDGVVLDFAGAVCELLNQYHDLPNTGAFDPGMFEQYAIEEQLSARNAQMFSFWYKSGAIANARDWYPGARVFLATLRQFADVEFLTAGGPGTWNEKTKNILATGHSCCRINFASPEKKKLHIGATLVEDKPETAESWAEANGKPAILLDRPWNHLAVTSPRVLRARNYGRVTSMIREILQ